MISPEKQALLNQATPRPWALGQCSEDGENWTPQVWPTGYGAPILRMSGRPGAPGRDEADATLIVAAVNDYKRLLTVEAERDALKEALKLYLVSIGYVEWWGDEEKALVAAALSSPVAEEEGT